MYRIDKMDLLEQVVEDAVETAARGCKSDAANNWTGAIVKAAAFLTNFGLDFLSYNRRSGELSFSFGNERFHTSADVCQCRTYETAQEPCWHRAAARLIAEYETRLNTGIAVVTMPQPGEPLLRCWDDKCGWAGPMRETRSTYDREPMCPKCDGRELYENFLEPMPARAPEIRRQLAVGSRQTGAFVQIGGAR